ncbi:MAG TPA: YciC family protein [Verrucomicrobiae bacterium]|nr:YciC family protein [Verrucomicrobiae bacterium]
MAHKHPQAANLPSAFALFKPSYEAIMVNIWTFLALLLLPIAGFVVSGAFGNRGGTDTNTVALLAGLVGGIAGLLVAPAIPFLQLKSVRGQEVTIGEALRGGRKYFWRFYGLSILTTLLVIGGFILLIVPGFFMIKRYLLAPFYLYDRKLTVREAMRQSQADSKPFANALWGVVGVSVLIGLLGVIPLLAVATAILQVVYYCAPAVRYEQIKKASKN